MPTAVESPTPDKPRSARFPPQIKFIVGNEACERFSFYGMRSILVIFMVSQLKMAASHSEAVFHLFVSACYFFPLIGGYIADRFWGKYNTILYLSLFYCAGHGTLALWGDSSAGLYAGLALIAMGSGGIKPCVSAYVGDQFTGENKHLVSKVYDLFYWSINFGSFFSTLMIPWVLPHFGASVAFGIPGALMGVATFVFWLGRKRYINAPTSKKTGAAGFMPVLLYALKNRRKRQPGQKLFDVAREKFKASDVEAAQAAANIFKVFITVSIFWSLWDQAGSSWVVQGTKMIPTIFGFHVEAAQMQAINPILILALIPVFSGGVYPFIEKLGVKMTALRRMGAGMIVTVSSFVSVALIQAALDHGRQISIAWQFIPYFLMAVAEVMVSITGLEFAYTQAPPSMKSTIMSFWLLTVFAGDLFTAYIAAVNVFSGSTFFFFFAGLMLAISLVFIWGAAKYEVRSFYEDGTVEAEG